MDTFGDNLLARHCSKPPGQLKYPIGRGHICDVADCLQMLTFVNSSPQAVHFSTGTTGCYDERCACAAGASHP
jgi:hypothetical protein